MSPVEEVSQLARQAEVLIDRTFNAPDVLPFADRALRIVKSHPELREAFSAQFIGLPSLNTCSEFVEVCMHELRWPETKAAFEGLCSASIERKDWRAEPVYKRILEAFEPDWENAKDFYAAYFNPAART